MKETSALISIIIPIYNTSKYLSKCIESAENQTYDNIEIILVNDGSTDDSPNICNHYKNKYKNIKVIHKENGGLSDARNAGINLSLGKYILFLDSDDFLDKHAIEKLYNNLFINNSDMVIPRKYIQVDEKTNNKKVRIHFNSDYFSEDPKNFVIKIMIEQGRAWRAHSLLYKSSIIKENNILFPIGFTSEDIIFNLDYLTYAKKISFIDYSTVFYLRRSGSITQSFREDLPEIFFYIDKKIKIFFEKNNLTSTKTENSKNQLLCRNIIICITEYFSNKSSWNQETKILNAKKLLNLPEAKNAFKINRISPFYESNIKRSYFKIMFYLIKFNKYKIAFRLAKLAGKKI